VPPDRASPSTAIPARQSGDAGPVPHARRAIHWPTALAWTLGAVGLFGLYLQLAGTWPTDSDGAGNALQAWDILHGNLLLHGWSLSDVSFYTTELPQYMLVELVRGLNQGDVHVAAAMTYTLAVVLAALLAKGRSTGREAAARAGIAAGIMLVPQLSSGVNVLMSSPDHIGTTVPVMVVWLILDRARPRWYIPVIAGALLAWAEVADPLVLYIGVLPLALVCAIRAYHAVAVEQRSVASQWYELALVAAAFAALAAAMLALHLIHADGGFFVRQGPTRFVPAGSLLPRNLAFTAEGLLLLGGADFVGLRLTASTVPTLLHLVGVFLAGWGTWLGARHFLRDRDRVAQVLVMAIAINLAAYVISTKPHVATGTREIAAVLPFSAALAAAGRAADGGQGAADPGRCPGRLPARFRLRDHPAPGARAEPAARLLAGGAPSAHRPVRLLAGERGDADQRRPGADPDGGSARRRPVPGPVRDEGLLVQPGAQQRELRGAVPRHPRLSRVHQRFGGGGHVRLTRADLPRRPVPGAGLAPEPARQPGLTYPVRCSTSTGGRSSTCFLVRLSWMP